MTAERQLSAASTCPTHVNVSSTCTSAPPGIARNMT